MLTRAVVIGCSIIPIHAAVRGHRRVRSGAPGVFMKMLGNIQSPHNQPGKKVAHRPKSYPKIPKKLWNWKTWEKDHSKYLKVFQKREQNGENTVFRGNRPANDGYMIGDFEEPLLPPGLRKLRGYREEEMTVKNNQGMEAFFQKHKYRDLKRLTYGRDYIFAVHGIGRGDKSIMHSVQKNGLRESKTGVWGPGIYLARSAGISQDSIGRPRPTLLDYGCEQPPLNQRVHWTIQPYAGKCYFAVVLVMFREPRGKKAEDDICEPLHLVTDDGVHADNWILENVENVLPLKLFEVNALEFRDLIYNTYDSPHQYLMRSMPWDKTIDPLPTWEQVIHDSMYSRQTLYKWTYKPFRNGRNQKKYDAAKKSSKGKYAKISDQIKIEELGFRSKKNKSGKFEAHPHPKGRVRKLMKNKFPYSVAGEPGITHYVFWDTDPPKTNRVMEAKRYFFKDKLFKNVRFEDVVVFENQKKSIPDLWHCHVFVWTPGKKTKKMPVVQKKPKYKPKPTRENRKQLEETYEKFKKVFYDFWRDTNQVARVAPGSIWSSTTTEMLLPPKDMLNKLSGYINEPTPFHDDPESNRPRRICNKISAFLEKHQDLDLSDKVYGRDYCFAIHGTDKDGLKFIRTTGFRNSKGDRAKCGKGVYMTRSCGVSNDTEDSWQFTQLIYGSNYFKSKKCRFVVSLVLHPKDAFVRSDLDPRKNPEAKPGHRVDNWICNFFESCLPLKFVSVDTEPFAKLLWDCYKPNKKGWKGCVTRVKERWRGFKRPTGTDLRYLSRMYRGYKRKGWLRENKAQSWAWLDDHDEDSQ